MNDNEREVLAVGAGALGGALASLEGLPPEVGAKIGQALLGAVIGPANDPDAEYKKEVLDRLNAIDSKLSEILVFLETKLATVIREQAGEALAIDAGLKLHAKAITIAGLVKAFDSHRGAVPKKTVEDLSAAGQEAFEFGLQLMLRGQQWYSGVIHAFATGLSAFSRTMATVDDDVHQLSTYAEQFAAYGKACLASAVPLGYWASPSPAETLLMAKLRVDSELAMADVRFAEVGGGPTTFLLGYNHVGPMMTIIGGYFSMSMAGVDGNHANGFIIWAGSPTPTPAEVAAELNRVHYLQRGWIVPTFFDFNTTLPVESNARYDAMVTLLWQAISARQVNPPIKVELEKAIPALTRLVESASKLSELKDPQR